MSINQLTQKEADKLVQVAKRRVDDRKYIFPSPGKRLEIPIRSIDSKHDFILDMSSARIQVKNLKMSVLIPSQ